MALDAQSWVEVVPGWMSGSRSLYERMAKEVAWIQHDRKIFDRTFREPRLTAQYTNLRTVPQRLLRCAEETKPTKPDCDG
jgi:hypothetical protein